MRSWRRREWVRRAWAWRRRRQHDQVLVCWREGRGAVWTAHSWRISLTVNEIISLSCPEWTVLSCRLVRSRVAQRRLPCRDLDRGHGQPAVHGGREGDVPDPAGMGADPIVVQPDLPLACL